VAIQRASIGADIFILMRLLPLILVIQAAQAARGEAGLYSSTPLNSHPYPTLSVLSSDNNTEAVQKHHTTSTGDSIMGQIQPRRTG